MSSGFRRSRGGGVVVTLEAGEIAVLDHLLGELVDLVAPPDDMADTDPLARAIGIGTATEKPQDPALARLFPDAYSEDVEAAADFRRYTEVGLRDTKVRNATIARASLHRSGLAGGDHPTEPSRNQRMRLTSEEAQAWLGALNDLRLTLGVRLDVTEDTEDIDDAIVELPEDDPRRPMWQVYLWLGWLQETLVGALI
jgi:Domain of unknown function (DUF2017)